MTKNSVAEQTIFAANRMNSSSQPSCLSYFFLYAFGNRSNIFLFHIFSGAAIPISESVSLSTFRTAETSFKRSPDNSIFSSSNTVQSL